MAMAVGTMQPPLGYYHQNLPLRIYICDVLQQTARNSGILPIEGVRRHSVATSTQDGCRDFVWSHKAITIQMQGA